MPGRRIKIVKNDFRQVPERRGHPPEVLRMLKELSEPVVPPKPGIPCYRISVERKGCVDDYGDTTCGVNEFIYVTLECGKEVEDICDSDSLPGVDIYIDELPQWSSIKILTFSKIELLIKLYNLVY